MEYLQVLLCLSILASVYSQCPCPASSVDDHLLFTCRNDSYECTLKNIDLEGKNASYVEIISTRTYLPDVHVLVKLSDIVLNHDDGDLLIIGTGTYEDAFAGAPGWMFVESQKETQNFHVIGRNVIVVFVARGLHPNRKVTISWKRVGTETKNPPTTSIPTTPVSEADRKAIILCFKKKPVTCKEFHTNTTERSFKIGLADVANRYAQKMKIELPRKIISSDIKATCIEVAEETNNNNQQNSTRRSNFLIVTITDRWNPELPVFTTEQLREIIKEFHSEQALGFQVAECRVYPNYWWWFWGSAIMLVFIIIIMILCCKWSDYEFQCMEESDNKKPPKKHVPNGTVNRAFVFDEFYETIDTIKQDGNVDNSPSRPTTPDNVSPSSPKDNPIFGSESNPPRGTPNLNSSRRLQANPSTGKATTSTETNPLGTPKLNKPKKFQMIPPSVKEDLILESSETLPKEPEEPPWGQLKEPDPDSLSRVSQHMYEDLDYFRLKLRQPSPTFSLRKQDENNGEDDDTEL